VGKTENRPWDSGILKLEEISAVSITIPKSVPRQCRVMYGMTSNFVPFTWLDNFSTRIFPYLLKTSTKFFNNLKWKAGESNLRWVAHHCPAEHQYILIVLKLDSKWQNSDIKFNFQSHSNLTTGSTVPNKNDESNDCYLAALRIEHNQTTSDGLEQQFKISYIRFKPLDLFSTMKIAIKVY